MIIRHKYIESWLPTIDTSIIGDQSLISRDQHIDYWGPIHRLWVTDTSIFSTLSIIFGTNGVAMARHGPILNDNEAMGSRKVSKYLPGLRDTITKSKIPAEVQQIPKHRISHYFYIIPQPGLPIGVLTCCKGIGLGIPGNRFPHPRPEGSPVNLFPP